MYKDDDLQAAAMAKAHKKHDKKRKGTRSRNISFLAYPDDLPRNWVSLISDSHLQWVEGPLHDKDTWSEDDEEENPDHKAGEFKKAHKHCLLVFDNPVTKEYAKKFFIRIFGEDENGSVKGIPMPCIAESKSGCVRYMAHMDHPSKAQYEVTDIIGHNGIDPFDIIKFSKTETLHTMIEIQQYIRDNDIFEYSVLCDRLETGRIDWYSLVTTKNTIHFKTYIQSRRNMKIMADKLLKMVDPLTGELK